MILDTCFILDLLQNDAGAVAKAMELKKEPVLTTAITVFELWQGASDLKSLEKKERIEKLLSSLGLLSLDIDCAKQGGIIHNDSYRKGKPIDPEDSMMAGIALTRNQAIVTRNIKHFKNVDKLDIVSY